MSTTISLKIAISDQELAYQIAALDGESFRWVMFHVQANLRRRSGNPTEKGRGNLDEISRRLLDINTSSGREMFNWRAEK